MLTPPPNIVLTLAALSVLVGVMGCTPDLTEPTVVRVEDLPELKAAPTIADLPRGRSAEVRDVTIALVGEVRGELEPCGCPTLPWGGFERRATLLKRLREAGPGPLFHIDAGDMLVKGFATQRADKIEERAQEMLRLGEMVGLDLWVVGPSDLLAMSPAALAAPGGPKRISATWLRSDGRPLLEPWTVLERDGFRLGVVGLSAPPTEASGLTARDPAEAAQEALEAMPDDVDWIIGVSNLDDVTVRRVSSEVKGLSAVLTTRGTSYDEPQLDLTAGTPIIETPDRGRYLQVIHARLASSPNTPVLLHPEPPDWRARLSSVKRGEPDALSEEGHARNLAVVNTTPLSPDLDEMGPIRARLEQYQEQRRVQARANAERPDPHGSSFASSGACVNCHSDEFARWTLSKHAQAWTTLVRREETQNPECVGCHTTGYGEPGGLGNLSETNIRKFKGVQCEECHGPMGGHPSDPEVTSQPVTEQSCLTCHDEANSPDFDYATYLPRASCQGGAPAVVPRPLE